VQRARDRAACARRRLPSACRSAKLKSLRGCR
jgi:hypothetical protein